MLNAWVRMNRIGLDAVSTTVACVLSSYLTEEMVQTSESFKVMYNRTYGLLCSLYMKSEVAASCCGNGIGHINIVTGTVHRAQLLPG